MWQVLAVIRLDRGFLWARGKFENIKFHGTHDMAKVPLLYFTREIRTKNHFINFIQIKISQKIYNCACLSPRIIVFYFAFFFLHWLACRVDGYRNK